VNATIPDVGVATSSHTAPIAHCSSRLLLSGFAVVLLALFVAVLRARESKVWVARRRDSRLRRHGREE
jgi:hypothetical protein